MMNDPKYMRAPTILKILQSGSRSLLLLQKINWEPFENGLVLMMIDQYVSAEKSDSNKRT